MRFNERFRLGPGQPKRLRICRHTGEVDTVEVFLDETPVATLPLAQVREGPVRIQTAAGELGISLKPDAAVTGWQLTLEGAPIPGSQGDPNTRIRFGAGAAVCIGICSAVMGASYLAVQPGLLKARCLFALGTLLAAAGALAWRRSRAAAWCATVLSLPTGLVFILNLASSSKDFDLEWFLLPLLLTAIVYGAVTGVDALEKQGARWPGSQ